MKSEVKNLCDKINNQLEKAPVSTTLLSLVENLNAKAIKQLSDGPNDLNYIISILLPKIQTISNISDLIPIVDDLVGYRGFSELTRLSNSLIENLYIS